MSRIQTTFVDTSALPPEKQFDEWAVHGIASRYMQVHVGSFLAQGAFWNLGHAVVTRAEVDPFVATRDAIMIAQRPFDHVQVVALVQGDVLFEAGEKIFDCRESTVFACDYRQPYRLTSSRTRITSVYMARSFLEEVTGPVSLHGPIPPSAESAFLANTLATLGNILPFAAATSMHYYARMLREVVAAAVRRSSIINDAGDHLDLRRRIESRLAAGAGGDVDIGSLCRSEALSRSTLYRLFRRDGGILKWDRSRRLGELYRAISNPAEDRPLGELGAAFGFGDSASLSRVFRRHFGLSPSEARRRARTGTTLDNDADTAFYRLRQSVEALSL